MSAVPTRRTTRATARRVDQNAGQQTARTVGTRKRTGAAEPAPKAASSSAPTTSAPPGRKRKALGDNTNAEKKKSIKKADLSKSKKRPNVKAKDKTTESRGMNGATPMRLVVEIPVRRRRASQPNAKGAGAVDIIDPSRKKSGAAPKAIPEPVASVSPHFEPADDLTHEPSLHVGPTNTITESPITRTVLPEPPEPGEPDDEPPAKRRRSNRRPGVSVDEIEVVGSSPAAPAQEQDNPFEIGRQSETGEAQVEMVSAQPWDDLDAEDENDPLMVAEYVVEIFDHMRELEVQTMPSSIYMSSQPELEWRMRGILMDWLIQVHARFRLLPETLLLATNLVDRFLSLRVVSLVKLQLVGITGLLVASKYEEIVAPTIHDFLKVADSQYSEKEILNAEKYMLRTLKWDLSFPNPMNWLRRASKADEYDTQTRTLAKFLIEISIVEERLLQYVPSRLAAAALWLARLILERPEWNANLEHYSGYPEVKLISCANVMVNFLLRPMKHESLWKKYSGRRYLKCAVYARKWAEMRWPPDPRRSSEVDEEEGDGPEVDLASALPILRKQALARASQEQEQVQEQVE